ncbi:cytochrome C [Cellulophaga sp. F20128]|uniref:cytochrome C n=1 Tax=Cellulophaga sp. F20128 TaxID=2926413 RepID=UPI001FF6B383|nr:cytochrome C [Cellulophaga sp. F20128]MCK0156792.1 cytochrome C [Cellulophaga sp. F20128]
MENKRKVTVFLDDEKVPFGVFEPPAKLILDTTKISDGKHTLKIKAVSSKGIEGVRVIPFEVRNGPEIAVIGLKDNEIIESNTAITINAYGSESSESFIIRGSETPKAIPSWVWACIIAFVGFAIFYLITHWTMNTYKSFF